MTDIDNILKKYSVTPITTLNLSSLPKQKKSKQLTKLISSDKLIRGKKKTKYVRSPKYVKPMKWISKFPRSPKVRLTTRPKVSSNAPRVSVVKVKKTKKNEISRKIKRVIMPRENLKKKTGIKKFPKTKIGRALSNVRHKKIKPKKILQLKEVQAKPKKRMIKKVKQREINRTMKALGQLNEKDLKKIATGSNISRVKSKEIQKKIRDMKIKKVKNKLEKRGFISENSSAPEDIIRSMCMMCSSSNMILKNKL